MNDNRYTLTIRGVEDENALYDAVGETMRVLEDEGVLAPISEDDPGRGDWAWERTNERLEYLREEIEAERISLEEIIELQGLADQIDPSDVMLLEWAGVSEFDE